MAYKMFLNGLLMPVCPGKVTVKVNGQNKTMNLLNGEEINLLKTPGLSDVSFELLLPHRAYPFSSSVVLPPSYYLAYFQRLSQRGTGFQWIARPHEARRRDAALHQHDRRSGGLSNR